MRWWFRRSSDDDDEIGLFQPSTPDHAGFQAEILASVERLLPDGVDEVTPHALDHLIDRHTAVTISRLMKQWLAYQDRLMPYLNEARADLAYEAVFYEADQRTVAELRAARDAAVAWLHDTKDPPPDLRSCRPTPPVPED